MQTLLREIVAGWVHLIQTKDQAAAGQELYNGNKWGEERWKNFTDAIAKSVQAGTFRVAGEQIAGTIGQVYVLLGDEAKPHPERICFMNVEGAWRMLASIGDFTACPFDYNSERQHAMIDLNCDYMKWAARKSQWTQQEMMGLEALLRLAKK